MAPKRPSGLVGRNSVSVPANIAPLSFSPRGAILWVFWFLGWAVYFEILAEGERERERERYIYIGCIGQCSSYVLASIHTTDCGRRLQHQAGGAAICRSEDQGRVCACECEDRETQDWPFSPNAGRDSDLGGVSHISKQGVCKNDCSMKFAFHKGIEIHDLLAHTCTHKTMHWCHQIVNFYRSMQALWRTALTMVCVWIPERLQHIET